MVRSKFLEQQFIKLRFDNLFSGVIEHQKMSFSNLKILSKLSYLKTNILKAGIFLGLTAYWSVILVGTFITFS